MAQKFIRDNTLRFTEQEIPGFYWELSVEEQGGANSTAYVLTIQLPVDGCGPVTQSFPLQREDLVQLQNWIAKNLAEV